MLCHYSTVVTSLSTKCVHHSVQVTGRSRLFAREARPEAGPQGAEYAANRLASARSWPGSSSPSMPGTTGVRALAVDEQARVADVAYRELTQHFPRPGWVEHDPAEIWDAVRATLAELGGRLAEAGRHGGRHRHHQPARDARRLRPLDRAAAAPGHRLAGPAHRGAVRRAHRGGPPPAGARPRRASSSIRTSAPPRPPGCCATATSPSRPTTRTSPSARSTAGCCGTSPAGTRRRRLRHRPLQRQPHPAARHGHPRLVRRALRPLRRARRTRCPRCARRRAASARPRCATSAPPRPSSTASRSRACWATSRPRCSGRPASSPAW